MRKFIAVLILIVGLASAAPAGAQSVETRLADIEATQQLLIKALTEMIALLQQQIAALIAQQVRDIELIPVDTLGTGATVQDNTALRLGDNSGEIVPRANLRIQSSIATDRSSAMYPDEYPYRTPISEDQGEKTEVTVPLVKTPYSGKRVLTEGRIRVLVNIGHNGPTQAPFDCEKFGDWKGSVERDEWFEIKSQVPARYVLGVRCTEADGKTAEKSITATFQ